MRGHPDQILGRLIHQRRTELGYTQDRLGLAIGRNRKFIERVERRGQTISPVYLKPLAKTLQLPLEQLLNPSHLDTVLDCVTHPLEHRG